MSALIHYLLKFVNALLVVVQIARAGTADFQLQLLVEVHAFWRACTAGMILVIGTLFGGTKLAPSE